MKLTFSKKEGSIVNVVIGYFDSIHIGHKSLLRKAKYGGKAKVVVFTFDKKINQENRKLVLDAVNKERLLRLNGADEVIVLKIEDVKNLKPDEFIEKYINPINPNGIFVGEDFRFGVNRSGGISDLKKHYPTTTLKNVKDKVGKISSTRIKEFIENGNLYEYKKATGRNYFCCGTVVKGMGWARKIGFPTANIEHKTILPKEGVYMSLVHYETEVYTSLAIISKAPTLIDDGEVKFEVHLLEENLNLYGKRICVEFIKFKRDIIKFENQEAIVRQIKTDCHNAKTFFGVI